MMNRTKDYTESIRKHEEWRRQLIEKAVEFNTKKLEEAYRTEQDEKKKALLQWFIFEEWNEE